MKTTAILFLAYLALCVQCSVPENKSTKKEHENLSLGAI